VVQVYQADVSVVHAFDQMVTNGGGEPRPSLDLHWVNSELFAKYEASQLIAQLLDLVGIAGGAKAFGQLKKCLLFLLLGFDSLFDEFHQHTVIAEGALFGQVLDLSGDLGWQGYASPDVFRAGRLCVGSFGDWHGSTIIHHCGASASVECPCLDKGGEDGGARPRLVMATPAPWKSAKERGTPVQTKPSG
jgi:hypothetical protein